MQPVRIGRSEGALARLCRRRESVLLLAGGWAPALQLCFETPALSAQAGQIVWGHAGSCRAKKRAFFGCPLEKTVQAKRSLFFHPVWTGPEYLVTIFGKLDLVNRQFLV